MRRVLTATLFLTGILCLNLTYANSNVLNGESSTEDEEKKVHVSVAWGKGIKVENADKTVGISFRGRLQTRLNAVHGYQNGRDAIVGAEVVRGRLKMEGYTKIQSTRNEEKQHWLDYKVQLSLPNGDVKGIDDGSGIVLDAFAMYHVNPRFDIWFGVTKLPSNLEFVISSQKQTFVDRSLANGIRLDRGLGFQFRGELGNEVIFRPTFSINLGDGRNQSNFSRSGFNYTFKAELLPFGKFAKDNKGKVGGAFKYFFSDVEREQTPKLSLSMVYDLNHNAVYARGQRRGDEVADSLVTSVHTIFADAFFKYNGFSAVAEYGQRRVKEASRSNYSTTNVFTTFASYVFKNGIEVAARYSRLTPLGNLKLDKDIKDGENAYTVALSKYIKGHNLKIQTDYTFYDEINSGQGIDNGEWRFQVEIAF